jgi:hypothetical protein
MDRQNNEHSLWFQNDKTIFRTKDQIVKEIFKMPGYAIAVVWA